MIGKGLFHTHLVVYDVAKSLNFYTGLFGMEQNLDFKDGTLVFSRRQAAAIYWL